MSLTCVDLVGGTWYVVLETVRRNDRLARQLSRAGWRVMGWLFGFPFDRFYSTRDRDSTSRDVAVLLSHHRSRIEEEEECHSFVPIYSYLVCDPRWFVCGVKLHRRRAGCLLVGYEGSQCSYSELDVLLQLDG